MSFSASKTAIAREDFETAVDEITPSPPDLTDAAAELFDTGRTIAKEIATKLTREDTALNVSISGHAPATETEYGYSSLTVSVGETAPVAAGVGG